MNRHGIRVALAAALLLAAGATFDSAKADPYGWCVIYNGKPSAGWLLWVPDFGSVEHLSGIAGGLHFYGRGVVASVPKPIGVDLGSVSAPLRYGWEVPTPWAGLEDTYFAALFLPVSGAS